jgi:hypothetical protein
MAIESHASYVLLPHASYLLLAGDREDVVLVVLEHVLASSYRGDG